MEIESIIFNFFCQAVLTAPITPKVADILQENAELRQMLQFPNVDMTCAINKLEESIGIDSKLVLAWDEIKTILITKYYPCLNTQNPIEEVK